MKPRIPSQKRSRNTKNRIMESAMKLFSKEGFHGVTAVDICREAGAATGSFYHYFSNKEDLFLAVTSMYMNEVASFQKIFVSRFMNHPEKELDLFLKSTLESHLLNPGFLKELMKMSLENENVKAMVSRENEEIIRFIQEFLKSYYPSFKETKLHRTAWLLYHSCEGIIHQYVLEGPDIKKEDLLDDLKHLYAASLGAPTIASRQEAK